MMLYKFYLHILADFLQIKLDRGCQSFDFDKLSWFTLKPLMALPIDLIPNHLTITHATGKLAYFPCAVKCNMWSWSYRADKKVLTFLSICQYNSLKCEDLYEMLLNPSNPFSPLSLLSQTTIVLSGTIGKSAANVPPWGKYLRGQIQSRSRWENNAFIWLKLVN